MLGYEKEWDMDTPPEVRGRNTNRTIVVAIFLVSFIVGFGLSQLILALT